MAILWAMVLLAAVIPAGSPLVEVKEGTRADMTGTPPCFINRRLLAGAQPLQRFAAIIEEDLAWAQ